MGEGAEGRIFTCFNGALDSIGGVHLPLPGHREIRNRFRTRPCSAPHHHIGEALILVGACSMAPRQHLRHLAASLPAKHSVLSCPMEVSSTTHC